MDDAERLALTQQVWDWLLHDPSLEPQDKLTLFERAILATQLLVTTPEVYH